MKRSSWRGIRPLLGIALAGAAAVGLVSPSSLAVFSSAASAGTGPISAGTWGKTFYLHDDGNGTAEAAVLVMDGVAPTADLGHFSRNCDTDAFGRMIGGDSRAICNSATWQTGLLSATTITGTAHVYVWTGIGRFNKINPPFESGPGGTLTIQLQRVRGASVTTIGTVTITRANWQNGSDTWIADTAAFNFAGYPINANDRLQVVLSMTATDSKFRAYAAYDAASNPARLVLP